MGCVYVLLQLYHCEWKCTPVLQEALHPTIPVPAVASSDAVEASLQATLQSSKLAALDTHLQQNPILHQAYLQVG